jgi:5'-nucleotidase
VNPGEIRTGLPAGDVSYARAFRAQPFGSSLVSMTLSGWRVLQLLQEQWCGRDRQRILQPSDSVRYVWSVSTAAQILGKPCAGAPNPVSGLEIDGRPVVPDGHYRVVTSSMLAGGFNRFDALRAGVDRADGPADVDALEAYLAPSLSGDPRVPPETDRIGVAP